MSHLIRAIVVATRGFYLCGLDQNFQAFLLSAQRFSDRPRHQITIVYKLRKINEKPPRSREPPGKCGVCRS